MTYTLLDGTTHFVVSLRDGMITIPMVMTIGYRRGQRTDDNQRYIERMMSADREVYWAGLNYSPKYVPLYSPLASNTFKHLQPDRALQKRIFRGYMRPDTPVQ